MTTAQLKGPGKTVLRAAEDAARTLPEARPVRLTLRHGTLVGVLVFVGVTLATLDLTTQTVDMTIAPGFPFWTQLTKLVDLDRENSLSTWYSIMLLAATSLAFLLIAWISRRDQDRMWRYWLALGLMFAAFSIDEQILGHESVGASIDDYFDNGGPFFYAWVVPGMIAVALAALAFIPFIRSLTPSLRARLAIAAGLYVGGALVMEMISGVVAETWGVDTLGYETTTSIEEMFEIAGVSFFLVILVGEISRLTSEVRLRFEGPA